MSTPARPPTGRAAPRRCWHVFDPLVFLARFAEAHFPCVLPDDFKSFLGISVRRLSSPSRQQHNPATATALPHISACCSIFPPPPADHAAGCAHQLSRAPQDGVMLKWSINLKGRCVAQHTQRAARPGGCAGGSLFAADFVSTRARRRSGTRRSR